MQAVSARSSDFTIMSDIITHHLVHLAFPSRPMEPIVFEWFFFLKYGYEYGSKFKMRLSVHLSHRAVAPYFGLSSLFQLHRTLTFPMNFPAPSCLCLLAGSCQQDFSYKMHLFAEACPHGLLAISRHLPLLRCCVPFLEKTHP